jgi:hypothetical protein
MKNKGVTKNTNKLALVAATVGSLLIAGCGTFRNNTATTKVAPEPIDRVNAHLEAGAKIEGKAEISTFEILGIRFVGGKDKKVGTVGNGLEIASHSLNNPAGFLNPLRWIFDSPASERDAVESAYYDAVDKSGSDGIIATKVKAEKHGFSLIHIIGWGTSSAEITGKQLEITPGVLPPNHK